MNCWKRKTARWWQRSISPSSSSARRLLVALLLALRAAAAAEAESLTPPFELEFAPADSTPLVLTIDARVPFTLVVDQQFADVTVRVPQRNLEVDSPTGDGGQELAMIDPRGERIRVEIGFFAAPAAQARVVVRAEPLPAGKAAHEAWDTLTRAGAVFHQGGRDNLEEARRLYLAASGHFQPLGRPAVTAHALYSAAAISRVLEDFDLARRLYTQVIENERLDPDQFLRARAMHMRGIVAEQSGDLRPARADYLQAEQIYTRSGLTRRAADVRIDRCWNQHALGAGQQARACLEELEGLLRPLDDALRSSNVAVKLGIVLEQLGEFEHSEAAYDRGLAYLAPVDAENVPARRAAGNALANRGRMHFVSGAEHRALVDYLGALRLLPTLDRRLKSYVFLNSAVIYARMGYNELAQVFLDWASQRHAAAEVADGVVMATLARAHLAANQAHPQEAETLLANATAALASSENLSLRAVAARKRIRVCLALDDDACIAEAVAASTATEAALGRSATPSWETLLGRAALAHRAGESATALAILESAAEATTDPISQAETALRMAEVLGSQGKPEARLARLRDAHRLLLDRRRERQVLLPDQSLLQRRVARALTDAVLARVDSEAPASDEILELIHELTEHPESLASGDPAAARQRQEAAARLAQASFERDDAAVEAILTALLEIESAVGQSAAEESAPLTTSLIQAGLEEGEVLLSYLLGEDRSLVLVTTPTRVSATPLPGSAELIELTTRWRSEIARRAPAERQLAVQLGRMLIPETACCSAVSALLFHDPGGLAHVPVSALIVGGQRLAQGVSVSRLARPSDRRLAPRRPSTTLFAGVGDPVFSGDDPRLDSPAPDVDPALRRLEGSNLEWAPLLDLLASKQTTVLTGFEAHKDAVLDPGLLDARILHLATHAFGNDRYGIGSGLFLTRYAPDGSPIESFVSSVEIAVRQVAADLVVLSACETNHTGSGLTLADAFVRAGARHVVASLWPVSNRATRSLMESFYSGLVEGDQPASLALMHAQRDIAAKRPWSHPYFWAAFQLHRWPFASR